MLERYFGLRALSCPKSVVSLENKARPPVKNRDDVGTSCFPNHDPMLQSAPKALIGPPDLLALATKRRFSASILFKPNSRYLLSSMQEKFIQIAAKKPGGSARPIGTHYAEEVAVLRLAPVWLNALQAFAYRVHWQHKLYRETMHGFCRYCIILLWQPS
jgi:hypothetical protein